MKECKKTTLQLPKIHSRCRVYCVLSSHALFLYFSGPSLLEMKSCRNFSLVSVLSGGFLNQLSNRRQTRLLCWRQTLLAMGTNMFGARAECVQNTRSTSVTHTHIASYQRLPNRLYVEMMASHRYSSPKTGGFILSYSLLSTLHSQVTHTHTHTHTIAFSAGLNGLQVD